VKQNILIDDAVSVTEYGYSEKLDKLLKGMMAKDPKHRPSARDVLKMISDEKMPNKHFTIRERMPREKADPSGDIVWATKGFEDDDDPSQARTVMVMK